MDPENIATETQTNESKAAKPSREAIIFVPGISQDSTDQSVEGIALRLATAMDRGAKSARAKFSVGDIREASIGEDLRSRATTIFRQDEGDPVPVVDVYKMEYIDLFLKKYREASPFVTIVRLTLAIVPTSLKLLARWGNRSLNWKEKLQFALAFFMMLLLFAYMVLVGLAIYNTGKELLVNREAAVDTVSSPDKPAETSKQTNAKSPERADKQTEPSNFARAWQPFVKLATLIALLLPALGFVVPSRAEIRRAIVDSATMVMALIFYFQAGERRAVLSGLLRDLLEHIMEQPDIEYSKVRVIAYSFGSVISLDTLFPAERAAGERFKAVHSLVTIGSPFDFVNLIWPNYFHTRHQLPGLKWYNIYSPEDVLSSNFRPYNKVKSAESSKVDDASDEKPVDWMKPPVNIRYSLRIGRNDLAWYEPFMFRGLRNHSLYWEPETEPQINAFDDSVISMFKGHSVLA